MLRSFAPGRVNLIGEHTDYSGGLCLPMAIDLGTTVTGERGGDEVVLTSEDADGEVRIPLDVDDPGSVEPAWGRYVAGVVAEVRPTSGFTGTIRSTLPIGAGLSSSASLELAVALALGADPLPIPLALLGQRAEQRASGVPCGVMDQLASAAGVARHALLIDCHDLTVTPVRVPPDVEIVVIHSGQQRSLVGSAYADRRAECEAAARVIGPLRSARVSDVDRIDDELLARRARHVITENRRVRDVVDAFARRDSARAGELMTASHASLRDDFEVSTDVLDALVDRLAATDGVLGARVTGAGFGGCVVALVQHGTQLEGWRVKPSAGARRTIT